MTIQYASDLHLEFPENEFYIKNNPLKPGADILLLGGDILQFKSMKQHDWFFDYISDNFGVTYWIAGNHEYYHFDLNDKRGHFKEEIRHNVFSVNNYAIRHRDARLIFATLWTNISPQNEIAITSSMNDFHLIKFHGDNLLAKDLVKEHKESLFFVDKELKHLREHDWLTGIVVTHHVPTFLHYPKEYLGDVLNEAFAVELKSLIETIGPKYWIYGHHHKNIPDFKIGATTLFTNQLGYVKYNENMNFDGAKIITI